LYEDTKGWRPREYRQGSTTVKIRHVIAGIHQFLAGGINAASTEVQSAVKNRA
jgi:hypothetical protein